MTLHFHDTNLIPMMSAMRPHCTGSCTSAYQTRTTSKGGTRLSMFLRSDARVHATNRSLAALT